MQALEQVLSRFTKRSAARFWIGSRPDVREGRVARAIAAQLGYPSSVDDPFLSGDMLQVDIREAAYVLALAGTRGLAYNNRAPSAGSINASLSALRDLSADAVFLTNGDWKHSGSCTWSPLSTATFDCGVIGYDSTNAFIFWVEEED